MSMYDINTCVHAFVQHGRDVIMIVLELMFEILVTPWGKPRVDKREGDDKDATALVLETSCSMSG